MMAVASSCCPATQALYPTEVSAQKRRGLSGGANTRKITELFRNRLTTWNEQLGSMLPIAHEPRRALYRRHAHERSTRRRLRRRSEPRSALSAAPVSTKIAVLCQRNGVISVFPRASRDESLLGLAQDGISSARSRPSGWKASRSRNRAETGSPAARRAGSAGAINPGAVVASPNHSPQAQLRIAASKSCEHQR